MATVKRCDRCHTDCNTRHANLEFSEYNPVRGLRDYTTYDLCVDCLEDFRSFMASGVKPIDPSEKKFKSFKRKD